MNGSIPLDRIQHYLMWRVHIFLNTVIVKKVKKEKKASFEQFSYLHHALFLNHVSSVPGVTHIVGQ